jgi:hypothetical protein
MFPSGAVVVPAMPVQLAAPAGAAFENTSNPANNATVSKSRFDIDAKRWLIFIASIGQEY